MTLRRLVARHVLGQRDGEASSTRRLVALATLARAETRSRPSTLPIPEQRGRHRAVRAHRIGER